MHSGIDETSRCGRIGLTESNVTANVRQERMGPHPTAMSMANVCGCAEHGVSSGPMKRLTHIVLAGLVGVAPSASFAQTKPKPVPPKATVKRAPPASPASPAAAAAA